VKIQDASQVLGIPVADVDGRRLGRIVAVDCTPEPYTAAWFVLRLRGWRLRLRAVLAHDVDWSIGPGLRVPYRRAQILASPTTPGDGLQDLARRGAIEAFYAAVPVG